MITSAEILNAKILIVDDKEPNVLLLAGILRIAGYTSVYSTTDPDEVCGLHRKNRYALILLDLAMPRMTGFEVMERLKELETDGYLPVIVITAHPAKKAHALEAGARDFLSKPFDMAEFRVRVHNMVEARLLHLREKKHSEALEEMLRELKSSGARELQEVERSNRELSEFSYAVSHDLKAPIRHVRMLAQLLARRVDSLQEDSSHLLNLIDQAAVGMDLLVESLLRYAQVGNGQLICKQVPMDSIIESVRTTLTPAIAKTRAIITWKPLPTIEADPILLEHLFQNLVANAIQYHRPEEVPMVEISASLCGEEWQFSVKDNGQGIPSRYQNRVFEPLKRLHGSENPGTGLGLALCRTIVARHGGKIWVESEGAGKGTIIRFTLPKCQTLQSVAASIS